MIVTAVVKNDRKLSGPAEVDSVADCFLPTDTGCFCIDCGMIRTIALVVVLLWGSFLSVAQADYSALLFDSGVPLIQLPTAPVDAHLSSTLYEVEANLGGEGPVAEYLIGILEKYQQNNKRYAPDHYGWSKVLWNVSAVAWVVEPRWLLSQLVRAPIVTDQLTLRFDRSRHMIQYVYFLDRDLIYKDFFGKIKNSIE